MRTLRESEHSFDGRLALALLHCYSVGARAHSDHELSSVDVVPMHWMQAVRSTWHFCWSFSASVRRAAAKTTAGGWKQKHHGTSCSSTSGPAARRAPRSRATRIQRRYTCPADAFPADQPRPVQPVLILRNFEIPQTCATHPRLVVRTRQCSGAPDHQGERDTDPTTRPTATRRERPPAVSSAPPSCRRSRARAPSR